MLSRWMGGLLTFKKLPKIKKCVRFLYFESCYGINCDIVCGLCGRE